MPKTLETLRAIDVRKIDLDEAQRHFDLPIDDQFASRRDLISGLSATKSQLLSLFRGNDTIEIWRGMSCDREWALTVDQGADVGDSWAWREEGALKGSSLDRTGTTGVMVKGVVDESDVDWEKTISVSTFHEAEFEIVVANPSAVTLTAIIEWPSGETIRDFTHEPSGPTM